MRKLVALFLIAFPLSLFAQQSYNMSLVGKLPYQSGLNDIWGYVDTDGTEYAIVGLVDATSFVSLADPSNPVEVANIPGPTSVWRDIKTWGNYAYVVHDALQMGDSQGLLIIDLTDISNGNITYDSYYMDFQFSRAHNIYIDENGVAYLFGGDYQNGGALMLDIATDPENPIFLGHFEDFYLHDGMVRGDTLWGGAIYNGEFVSVDVSDKSNPIILGSAMTPNAFTHNCWVSDDGQTVYTTDELAGSYIAAFDVSNINDIQLVDQIQSWSPQNDVIPHNTHVMGNYLVTSYYCDGVTVVDASDPTNLQEVAYYDTSVNYQGDGYNGAWGAYPFLPSKLILVSDRQEGLHILSVDNLEFSVESLNYLLDIQVYPNPSVDFFQIKFKSNDWATIQVSDINGRHIQEIENHTNSDFIQLGEAWELGTYLIRIEDFRGLSITHTIVKQ